jgi:uncharacterized protein
MRSALYVGHTLHRRLRPVTHAFRHPLCLAYLDLAELPLLARRSRLLGIEARRPFSFRRADHLGDPAQPLDRAVRDLVEVQCGWRPDGPIALLTQLRRLGWLFNPVSFYYCFEAVGGAVGAVVADVTNTPWHERHAYVLRRRGPELRFRVGKELHVSPFLGMDLEYDFRFAAPGAELRAAITAREDGEPVLHAALEGERRELGGRARALALLQSPLATVRVSASIYAQALRLRLRGAPFHPHPAPGAALKESR